MWRTISRALAITTLYGLRLALAPVETPKGVRRVILAAAPLPAAAAIDAPEGEDQADEDALILPGPGETKKDVFLQLYRGHFAHGNRELASKTAAELAPRAGLQPGTARSYVYAELDVERAGGLRMTGPRKLPLTAAQRQQVQQARRLAAAEPEQIAGLGPGNEGRDVRDRLRPYQGHRHRPAGHYRRADLRR